MNDVLQSLAVFQQKYLQKQQPITIAYSGGLDSHALLHAARALKFHNLSAIHVNHGLSPNADKWQTHCQQVCAELQIPLRIIQLHITKRSGESLEALSRTKRYQAFQDNLAPGTWLLTAHHQDDQAETVLLHLLRGAGPTGLAAMPAYKPLGHLHHGRPLLSLGREQLQQYGSQQTLAWVDDESNFCADYQRNFLRLKIMPQLKQYWPQASQTISRAAQHCADAVASLQTLAKLDYEQVATQEQRIIVDRLMTLTPARQFGVLRFWLKQQGFAMPSTIKLKTVVAQSLYAKEDAVPCIHWPGAAVYRYQGLLYVTPPLGPKPKKARVPWQDLKPINLSGGLGQLVATKEPGQGIKASLLQTHELYVGFRQGGERIKLKGHQITHQLKKLWQQWQVPPWLRDFWPLIYLDQELAAVPGKAISAQFAAQAEEPGINFAVQLTKGNDNCSVNSHCKT